MNGGSKFDHDNQHIATIIDVPVKGTNEVVSIDCSELPPDPHELCELLSGEDADPKYWVRLAVEYRLLGLTDPAIEILLDGLNSRSIQRESSQRPQFHSLLASLYIGKARHAPTGMGKQENDVPLKDYWQHKATQALQEASRLNQQSATIQISRGVLAMMSSDKDKVLEKASKQFEAALRGNSRNLFAMLGKARVLYTRKNYKTALTYYQKVLLARPNLVPDPRIGIGLCFWQLNMRDDALTAWERAHELDSSNMIVVLLLGIFWVAQAFSQVADEAAFQHAYARGIKLVSQAYKADPMPLAGIVLASHLYSTGKLDSLQKLLEKAIQGADIASIKADAFFWIGRGQHVAEIYDKANSFYQLARQMDPESIVASMAIGQLQLTRDDVTDAKLTFESVLETNPKCIEALAVLGSIYAREILDPTFKGDKATHLLKAKACLDKAISLTDDSKQRNHTDPSLHFMRAMLAEGDQPAATLRVLEQASDIQKNNDLPQSPQILNNMAVLYHQAGNYDLARDVYQKAIEESIKISEEDADSDVLIATMTYNLGRCEEESGNIDQAKEIYEGLLTRYPDYVEASARLCYMAFVSGASEEAATRIKSLIDIDPNNTEVRALYGWILNKQKKNKALHFNEDPERKHFNHTLKYVDNYERYSLVALGNFYIKLARETKADSDIGKAERHKHYDMAIKFFERALHYDTKNAYAAQGLGIAFAEHKQYQKAITIFSKVREALRDESIFLNMGHCLCELHQYSRAIENYETALNTFHNGKDLNLYQCLGRAWLSRGREERNADHLREALRYAKLALIEDPGNTSIQFNVAFIQFQFAEILRNTTELNRTVADLEEAAVGLNAAVRAFTALAEHKQPPYPKADIVQRATMGRNTTTRQLERAIQQQKEYEHKNAAKVAEAKSKRDEERAGREAAQEEAKRAEQAKQALLAAQRKQMQDDARQWADKRRHEEEEREIQEAERAASKKEKKGRKNREVDENDSNDGIDDGEATARGSKTKTKKKKKRTLRKAKSRKIGSDSEQEAELSQEEADGLEEGDEEQTKPTKKRKLSKKYISKELIDSEDDEDEEHNLDEDMPDVNGAAAAAVPPAIGSNAYANENMANDGSDVDEHNPNIPNHTAHDDTAAVPINYSSDDEAGRAPVTNQPDQSDSVLLNPTQDRLGQLERPGIGVDGVPTATNHSADDADEDD